MKKQGKKIKGWTDKCPKCNTRLFVGDGELEKIGKAIDVPMAILMHGGGTYHFHHRPEDGDSYCEWVEY